MPFGLHLHFPFCQHECSYCSFYKECYDRSREREFYRALMKETELAAARYADVDPQITSVFVGGGTPSLTAIELFTNWLNLLRRLFDVPEGIEFTLESNPESATLEALKAFRKAGVNRPVIGVQTFDVGLLGVLDRRHRPHDSQRVVYHANALGFRNFGVDLIYSLPGQTSRMLSADLDQLIDLNPPHISFYELAVKEGTRLYDQVASGEVRIPNAELTRAMYRGGTARLQEAGYDRYEVCSFAKPGFEGRYNSDHWDGLDYLGLGPSARSFMQGTQAANPSSLTDYIDILAEDRLPTVVDDSSSTEHMTEAIMLGLRTTQGINRSRFSQQFGVPVEDRLDREQYELLLESGHLVSSRNRLRLSEEGITLADQVAHRLLR